MSVAIIAHGAVTRFDESFDGDGPYQDNAKGLEGLDNEDWFINGNGSGSLEDDGFHFNLRGEGGGSKHDALSRIVDRNGGFAHRITFRNLFLESFPVAPSPDAAGWISFSHSIGSDFSQRQFGFVLQGPHSPQNSSYNLFLHAGSDSSKKIEIPPGSSPTIELRYDSVAKSASMTYDNDTTDSIRPILFTEADFLLLSNLDLLGNSHIVLLDILSAGHNEFTYSGLIDHWSYRPFSGTVGDLNGNLQLDVDDLAMLSDGIRQSGNNFDYDLDFNNRIDQADLQYWIHDLKKTYYGDANLDGEFNSADLVNIFAEGKYEDGISTNARWESGDWNADLEFNTSDLVVAFQDGGYEQGPMQAAAVPEAVSLPLVLLSSLWCLRRRDRAA